MALSWNQIMDNAVLFSKKFENGEKRQTENPSSENL